jgi:hypothetical protein
MGNGFLDDLPDLDLPGKGKGKTAPAPVLPGVPKGVVIYHKVCCPKCGSDKAPVVNSSNLPVRYHKCLDCGHTFKSIEITKGKK